MKSSIYQKLEYMTWYKQCDPDRQEPGAETGWGKGGTRWGGGRGKVK